MVTNKLFFHLRANQINKSRSKGMFLCILSVLTRLVGLISTKTIEYFFGRHLCNRSMP